MNLEKKKILAAKTFGVGKGRIVFNSARIGEIKEAITKQDMRDLVKDKAIIIREISGTRKKVKRKTRRRSGSIKIKVKRKKEEYKLLVRKLRKGASELREKKVIDKDQYIKLRKEIRSGSIKSKAYLKERIAQMREEPA